MGLYDHENGQQNETLDMTPQQHRERAARLLVHTSNVRFHAFGGSDTDRIHEANAHLLLAVSKQLDGLITVLGAVAQQLGTRRL